MIRMVARYPLKIGGLALLVWLVVRGRLPQTASIVVAVVLAILLHIAIAALLTNRRRLADSRLLKNSLRGELPRDGQRIAVAGTIEADGDLLQTPFDGVPCILYQYEIYRMVRSRSKTSRSGVTSTSTPTKVMDFSGVALTPATIRTSNGRFALFGFPFLSGPVRKTGGHATRLAAARDYIRRTEFARTVPFVGELAALEHAAMTVERAIRLDCQMSDGDKIEVAFLEEDYVPNGARTCAFGPYSAANHGLVPGHGAEQRISLIAGEGAHVLRDLMAGVRSSRIVAATMVLIVAAVLAFVFGARKELLDRVTGEPLLIDTLRTRIDEL
jgi:hypothetical protein